MEKTEKTRIDFTKIEVPGNLAGTRVTVMDIREPFADIIYRQGTGIACRALALKIYNSRGEAVYDGNEVALIAELASNLLTPAVMDGIRSAIGKGGAEAQQTTDKKEAV